ncbi:unnamed protein product, partial [Adineta ricciae]
MDIHNPPLIIRTQSKKKCHGNRRNRRFRRKWRQRGMKPAKIERLLNERNRTDQNQRISRRDEYFKDFMDDIYVNVPATTEQNINKRKREVPSHELTSTSLIPKSISSISIRQPLKKKMNYEKSTTEMHSQLNYKRPMYLKRSPRILFQTLSNKLNYPIQQEDLQMFIYKRLHLLDRICYFELDLQLWTSYLNIGWEQHQWP